MKTSFCVVALIAAGAALSAQNAPKAKSILSTLKVGKSVSLKDEGAGYSISFLDEEVPQSHTVIEIGDDFVVMRDIAGVTETVVPVYSLKSIERVKTKLE